MCGVECGMWDVGCGVQLAHDTSDARDVHEVRGVCACVCDVRDMCACACV